jgi:hypothetical protein
LPFKRRQKREKNSRLPPVTAHPKVRKLQLWFRSAPVLIMNSDEETFFRVPETVHRS